MGKSEPIQCSPSISFGSGTLVLASNASADWVFALNLLAPGVTARGVGVGMMTLMSVMAPQLIQRYPLHWNAP